VITFRVHFADGSTLDVDAENPTVARKQATALRPVIISKVKVVKERADA